jgi:hypothetical protein
MTNQKTIVQTIKMECVDEQHCKQWEASLAADGTVTTRWGRIGSTLQEKEFPGAGSVFYDKKVKEKLNKGYYVAD